MDEQTFLLRQQIIDKHAETEKEVLNLDEQDRQFDNELLLFTSQLAKNQSTKDIADFISSEYWSTRQKNVIKYYAKIILGNGLATSFLNGYRGLQRMKDLKALTDCDLTLGLTTFDLTDKWVILRDMIDHHYELELNKSVGGFIIKRIGTKTHEIQHEEKNRSKEQGLKEKIGWNTQKEYD